jgi:hypothetical protein
MRVARRQLFSVADLVGCERLQTPLAIAATSDAIGPMNPRLSAGFRERAASRLGL